MADEMEVVEEHDAAGPSKGGDGFMAPVAGLSTPWVEKYRPETLGDVIAHTDIVSTCERQIHRPSPDVSRLFLPRFWCGAPYHHHLMCIDSAPGEVSVQAS